MPVERNTEFSTLPFVMPTTAIIRGKRKLRQILLVTDYIAVFEEEITWLHTLEMISCYKILREHHGN